MHVTERQRPGFAAMVLGNTYLLFGLYLCAGMVVEGIRRWAPYPWVLHLSLVMDSLPGRVLELTGAMDPLRTAYVWGRLSGFGVRLVFGVTTYAVILALAVVVGILTGIGRLCWHLWGRRADRAP